LGLAAKREGGGYTAVAAGMTEAEVIKRWAGDSRNGMQLEGNGPHATVLPSSATTN
jgi:hypothetical protein